VIRALENLLLVLVACVLVAGSAPALAAADGDELVLVTSSSSRIESLNAGQIRRAFMGLSVTLPAGTIKPLVNDSSADLRFAFLQHIVGLSESMYERRRLALALQQGVAPPQAFRSEKQLLEQLERQPMGISFTWRRSVIRMPGLRVIKVLWQP
jgi:hypothetical protein